MVGVGRDRGPRRLARGWAAAVFRHGAALGRQVLGRPVALVALGRPVALVALVAPVGPVAAPEQASWVERGSPLQVMLASSGSKTHPAVRQGLRLMYAWAGAQCSSWHAAAAERGQGRGQRAGQRARLRE